MKLNHLYLSHEVEFTKECKLRPQVKKKIIEEKEKIFRAKFIKLDQAAMDSHADVAMEEKGGILLVSKWKVAKYHE